MVDPGLWDEEPVLSRRERLRQEREAAQSRPVRARLRIIAASALVVAILAWLFVSWAVSSPSSSEPLPPGPEIVGADGEGPRPREEPEGLDVSSSDAEGGSPEEAGSAETPLVVHVVGAVEDPGIAELPPGSRVDDAVQAAGGASDEAALDALNLAAPVVDGSLIHVPTREEVESGELLGPGLPVDDHARDGAGGGGDIGEVAPVDLNSAGPADLERLPGIGPALAERIIAHREQHGPFGSLEELAAVRGVGPAILEDVADQVVW